MESQRAKVNSQRINRPKCVFCSHSLRKSPQRKTAPNFHSEPSPVFLPSPPRNSLFLRLRISLENHPKFHYRSWKILDFTLHSR
ncbi:hypothetical protein BT93_G1189 [Corymbia citriodora subsp. variegata]|nr:hypothetical protein BT93_G1189 [Corymbia citriodora subsp. variegata]